MLRLNGGREPPRQHDIGSRTSPERDNGPFRAGRMQLRNSPAETDPRLGCRALFGELEECRDRGYRLVQGLRTNLEQPISSHLRLAHHGWGRDRALVDGGPAAQVGLAIFLLRLGLQIFRQELRRFEPNSPKLPRVDPSDVGNVVLSAALGEGL